MSDLRRVSQQIAHTHLTADVIFIPAGPFPKYVRVRLRTSDGPAVEALWNGTPPIAVDETVICRRDPNDNNILVIGEGAPAVTSVQWQTGILQGGNMVAGSGLNFVIEDGAGYVTDNLSNPDLPNQTFVEWSGLAEQSPLNFATTDATYVFIDSTGAPSLTNAIDYSRLRDFIYLGYVFHNQEQNTVTIVPAPKLAFQTHEYLWDLLIFQGVQLNGFDLACVTGGLTLQHYGGQIWYPSSLWHAPQQKDPNRRSLPAQSPITFTTWLYDRAYQENQTNVPVGFYDDKATPSAPIEIPGADTRASLFWVYLLANAAFSVQYGQNWYDNLDGAIEAVNEERITLTVPQFLQDLGTLVAVVAAIKGATDLCNTEQGRVIRVEDLGALGGGSGGGIAPAVDDTRILGELGWWS